MIQDWFRSRRYKHFDVPVDKSFAEACDPSFVERHSWSPHIHYVKETKRYKPLKHKVERKRRDIMYASHRDACVLSKYAYDLSSPLEAHYAASGLSDNVIGYRKLGKANYDFSARALKFAKENMPCVILCFDISNFFDTLDHSILKARLRDILGVTELTDDWYAVYRQVTKFRSVERDALAAHPIFSKRMQSRHSPLIATMAEVTAANIQITKNASKIGIPQGTPISAIFANLYLVELDAAMRKHCDNAQALYQRYSDDIIVICKAADEMKLLNAFEDQINIHKLKLSAAKCDRLDFDASNVASIQYLGFELAHYGPSIRSSSISRQFRKLRKAIRRTRSAGEVARASGRASNIFTKKLWKRFGPVGARNFSSYARNSATVFKSKRIKRQIKRFERLSEALIRGLNQP